MTNHKFSLDGDWEFQRNPQQNTEATLQTEWRSVLVPSPGQAQFDVIAQALLDGMLKLL